MLTVASLRKSFGALTAVDGVSFAIEPGEIYGLLGPNGAGKSTTIGCIAGLLRPDHGTIRLDGIDAVAEPLRARGVLGVVPQETAIYESLTARENVAFFATLHGLNGPGRRERVDSVLERVGLDPGSRQTAAKFSGGMKRRLNLAIGLVSRPKVLLLDEPTVGIDPQARIHILDLVREAAGDGAAILYTTHYLEEAETLCRRVGIVDHGRILAEGTVAELRREAGEGMVFFLRGRLDPEVVVAAFSGEPGLRLLQARDGSAVVAGTGERPPASLLTSILGKGLEITDVSMQEPNLESLFIRLTGRELRD